MLSLGFQLEATPLIAESVSIESPIAGLNILFTGKMLKGNRDEMKIQARSLGAKVLSGPTSSLQLLVIGDKASASKISKAEKFGAEVITEDEYLERLDSA